MRRLPFVIPIVPIHARVGWCLFIGGGTGWLGECNQVRHAVVPLGTVDPGHEHDGAVHYTAVVGPLHGCWAPRRRHHSSKKS